MKQYREPLTPQSKISMAFKISSESGAVAHPKKIKFFEPTKKSSQAEPLPFWADALTGVSALKLFQIIEEDFKKTEPASAPQQVWQMFEPSLAVYNSASTRLKPLFEKDVSLSATLREFEESLKEILKDSFKNNQVDLESLSPLLDSITYLEQKMRDPIVYNLKIQFSENTMDILHSLYSFLFHLRSLIAVDYNQHIHDPAFEAIKVDPIYDYLPKPEYILNDAILCHEFFKYQSKNKNSPEGFSEFISKTFARYGHNGFYLYSRLKDKFFSQLNGEALEDSLYSFQMDWLLGSPAGILFRIREELFALSEGYENIFWHELQNKAPSKMKELEIYCQLGPQHLRGHKAA